MHEVRPAEEVAVIPVHEEHHTKAVRRKVQGHIHERVWEVRFVMITKIVFLNNVLFKLNILELRLFLYF